MIKFLILFLFSINCLAANYKVISVYDGDTFKISFKDEFITNPSVRIRGIDTPELGWRASCKAENTSSINARNFLIGLILDKEVRLENIGRDKYGRILADVFIENVDIGKVLIDKGFAKPYEVNIDWCKDEK